MKTSKLTLPAILLVAVMALPVTASVIYTTGSPITYTFDGMPTSDATPPDTVGSFSATVGVQGTVTGSGGWEATKISGTGSSAMNFVADNGGSNSGAVYSYGAAQATDRALGSLASGSNVAAFGIEIVNGNSNPIFEVRISFTQENWRSSTSVANVVPFSYSTSDSAGVTSANYLSVASGFTAVTALNLTGPAPVASNGALNGNDPANQAVRAAVITGLSIDPGQSLFLRFQDANDLGNDAGLAIDNFTIALIPEPTSFALMFACIGAMVLRRK